MNWRFENDLLDVAVIGGGPAGISACLELARRPGLKTALFESAPEVGGLPRTCGPFFGLRHLRRLYSGPAYARRLRELLAGTSTLVLTETTVTGLSPGPPGGPHLVEAVSPAGVIRAAARFVLLATGCFEASREERRIPGDRPAGIYTTGALQQLVRLHGLRPGRRAVIVGGEAVGFSAALTLRRAGVEVAALVEPGNLLQVWSGPALALARLLGLPILRGRPVAAIHGPRRVEAVELAGPDGRTSFIDCDTVVVSGRFRPDSALVDHTAVERDPASRGPAVDQSLTTSVPGILAAGNVLRGADMHDLCALEGRRAARTILAGLDLPAPGPTGFVRLRVERPIRFAVPQLIDPDFPARHGPSWLGPVPAFQVERTLIRPRVTAVSGDREVWSRSYRRLLGRMRVPLPLERFTWSGVDPAAGLTLRVTE